MPQPMSALRPVLLMTRPRSASERFVGSMPERLRGAVDVVIAPLMEIVPLSGAVDLQGLCGVIFTSANGVAAAATLGVRPDLPCYCVGDATADAARQSGWRAESMGPTADALVSALLSRAPEGPLVHLRGVHARGDVAERLTAGGLPTRDRSVYDQRLLPLGSEAVAALSRPTLAPLFSPRSARHFAQVCPHPRKVAAVALSDAVAAELDGIALARIEVSETPDAHSLAKAIETTLWRGSWVEA